MLDQNLAREVLACAVRTGGAFAEIFMEDRVDHTLLMRSGRIENVNSGRIHGAGIRVYCKLAAYYSKGRNHPALPVDYTKRKYVKKSANAAAGMVTYTHFQTAIIGLTAEDQAQIMKAAAKAD